MFILSEADVKRLSFIIGVPRNEWGKDDRSYKDIEQDLSGDIEQAFETSLPRWLELGRVHDFSHGFKAPIYRPHYGTLLGRAFVEKFYSSYSFLLVKLREYLPESAEYLSICDLLIYVLEEFDNASSIPREILELTSPVPEVIKREYGHDDAFVNQMNSLGEFFQAYVKEWD